MLALITLPFFSCCLTLSPIRWNSLPIVGSFQHVVLHRCILLSVRHLFLIEIVCVSRWSRNWWWGWLDLFLVLQVSVIVRNCVYCVSDVLFCLSVVLACVAQVYGWNSGVWLCKSGLTSKRSSFLLWHFFGWRRQFLDVFI